MDELRGDALPRSRWPSGLLALPRPPGELRIVGSVDAQPSGRPSAARRVAIVGSRRASPEAQRFARSLAAELAEAGVLIVSGGAYGVDAAAHRGALDARAPTWVVLATGFSPPYPGRHRHLFAEIVHAGGALLSEVPDGTPPHAGRFLDRNRLIAALADAVVVIEAPARSGALSTARWSARLGRKLLAVPSPPWNPLGAGGLALLASDEARPCAGSTSVLVALGITPPPTRRRATGRKRRPPAEPMGAEARILRALTSRSRDLDELAEMTGLEDAALQSALLELEASGHVTLRSDGTFAQRVP